MGLGRMITVWLYLVVFFHVVELCACVWGVLLSFLFQTLASWLCSVFQKEAVFCSLLRDRAGRAASF